MAFNLSKVYSLPTPEYPLIPDTLAESTTMNTLLEDFEAAFNDIVDGTLGLSLTTTAATFTVPVRYASDPVDNNDLARKSWVLAQDATTLAATGGVVFDTVAAVEAATGVGTTWISTRGYSAAGDGGHSEYWYDASDHTTPGNHGTVVVDADGKRWKLRTSGHYVNAKCLGVACDGVTGDSDNLAAADAMVRALNLALFIDGVCYVDKLITIANPTHWIFSGHHGSGGSNLMLPKSYLLGSSTLTGGQSVIFVVTDGVKFEGGGIIGEPGYLYDGLVIAGNNFRWTGAPYFGRCGRDGCRIGDDMFTVNANSTYLEHPVSAYNARHGINIDDGAITDANTFQINKPFCHHNTGHGIRFGRTFLGGTVIAPLCESNTIGMYFESTASGIVIVGGDLEANDTPAGGGTLKNLVEVVVGQNFFVNTTIQGVLRNDLAPNTTMERNVAGRVALDMKNTDPGATADLMFRMTTTAGIASLWKRSLVAGGELLLGHEGAYPFGIMLNGIIRWGFLHDGSLALGGFSAVGTAGQVLTSQGPGMPVVWGAAGGSSTPLTTKGDLFTYSSVNTRLGVGTNGQVLMADSAEVTGLKWTTVAGTGTVTSVAMTVPTGLTVGGSPITAAGTFAVTWTSGYRAYTDAENTKLAGLPTTAVNKTGDTMSGDLTVSKADAAVIANATSGNGNLVAQSGSILAGVRAGGGAIELGGMSAHEVRLLGASGTQRIIFTTGGLIRLLGLPVTNPGVSGAIWNDGGTLKIV